MSDVVKSIGKFASSVIGNIFQIGTGIVGTILLTTPFASLGWILIGTSLALGFAGNYYEYQQYKKLQEKLKKSATGHLVNTKQSNTPLPIVYGTCRVGGNIVFIHTDGKNNENLWMVMTLSEGRIEIGEEVLILNDNPIFKYVKKSNNQWILKIKISSITNIKLKIKYQNQEYNYYTEDYNWKNKEENLEISLGETKITSDNKITIQYTSNDNILITVNNSNETRIDNVVIYEYSEDNGTTWKKHGNYENFMSYFIDRGDGTGKGDISVKDYIVNTLGFKIPKDVALLYIKLVWKEGKWQGVPNITVLLKGKNDIYDPRDNQYKFTNNPALILLDYLTSKRYGFGIPLERIDLDSFIEVANYCDNYGFIFDGIITDGRGIDIIEHILNHFRGYLVYQNGKFKVKVRDLNIETPVAIITEDNIIEGTFQINIPDISEIPNVVKVKYINPEIDYKVDELLIEDINVSSTEERKEVEIELYGCNTLQAKLLGTYYLERARLNLTVSFVVSPEFFNLELGDLFYLDYPSYGIEGKIFRIVELTPTPEGFCKITAIIEDEKLYNNNVDLDIYNIDLTNIPLPTDPPPNVSNVQIQEISEFDNDGALVTYLKLTWDNIPFVESYEIWSSIDGINWKLEGITRTNEFKFLVLQNKTYQIKIIPISIYGTKLDFNSATIINTTTQGIKSFDIVFDIDDIKIQHSIPNKMIVNLNVDMNSIVDRFEAWLIDNSGNLTKKLASTYSTTLEIPMLYNDLYSSGKIRILAKDVLGNISTTTKDISYTLYPEYIYYFGENYLIAIENAGKTFKTIDKNSGNKSIILSNENSSFEELPPSCYLIPIKEIDANSNIIIHIFDSKFGYLKKGKFYNHSYNFLTIDENENYYCLYSINTSHEIYKNGSLIDTIPISIDSKGIIKIFGNYLCYSFYNSTNDTYYFIVYDLINNTYYSSSYTGVLTLIDITYSNNYIWFWYVSNAYKLSAVRFSKVDNSFYNRSYLTYALSTLFNTNNTFLSVANYTISYKNRSSTIINIFKIVEPETVILDKQYTFYDLS